MIKKFEQHTNKETYYAIRWLDLQTNKFGEPEGMFKSIGDVLDYLGEDVVDRMNEVYDIEFIIVEIHQSKISKEDIDMWKESNKYNI